MNKTLYLFLLVFILSSCSIKKTKINNFSSPPKNTSEIIKLVNSKNIKSKWISLKGKANIIQRDQQFSVTLNIKNRKDSIIWCSASGPFGIEIIRVQLTPDSIYFINRINKTYLIKPVSRLKDFMKSDFSFYDVQDMITASPKILTKNYKFELNNSGYDLISDNRSYSITNNFRIQNVKTSDHEYALELMLDDYHEDDNFPRKLTLKVNAAENFEITINYSNVEFNKTKMIFFAVPDSYYEIN